MLDPYAESFSSTGEPPTVPPESSTNTLYCTQTICNDNHAQTSHEETTVSLLSTSARTRTLSGQEDSGYEASPSSIVGNQSFFGEQPIAVANQVDLLQSCNLNVDEEFDFVDCHSVIPFAESESDLEDYDTCQESCSSYRTCIGSRTEDSLSTNATAISNCDNSSCNSSDLTFNRPSSQPIEVPTPQSCRISPETRSRLIYSLGSFIDMYPEVRSLPVNISQLHSLGLIPESHPLSWPSITYSPSRNQRRTTALSSPRNHHISMNRSIPNRYRTYNHPRSRRQLIDSEASSFCSSDDEGSEDVFNMSAEESLSFSMATAGSAPLPDVILETTDSGRSRCVSINLPQTRAEMIRDVGRRLRLISDEFGEHRQERLSRGVLGSRNRSFSDCSDTHPNGLS